MPYIEYTLRSRTFAYEANRAHTHNLVGALQCDSFNA